MVFSREAFSRMRMRVSEIPVRVWKIDFISRSSEVMRVLASWRSEGVVVGVLDFLEWSSSSLCRSFV